MADRREAAARQRIDEEFSEIDEHAKLAERSTLLTLSNLALKANKHQVALNAVLKCQQLITHSDHELTLALAAVLWSQGESGSALRTLGSFLASSRGDLKPQHEAIVLAQMVSPALGDLYGKVIDAAMLPGNMDGHRPLGERRDHPSRVL